MQTAYHNKIRDSFRPQSGRLLNFLVGVGVMSHTWFHQNVNLLVLIVILLDSLALVLPPYPAQSLPVCLSRSLPCHSFRAVWVGYRQTCALLHNLDAESINHLSTPLILDLQ